MIILKSNDKIDALEVIKENGFTDLTPEISNASHKFFEKGGELFRFLGWHEQDKKYHWHDIEIIKISEIGAESLKKYADGEIIGALMFEIAAALSLHLYELDAQTIEKINKKWAPFSISTDKNGKKYVKLDKSPLYSDGNEYKFFRHIKEHNETRARIGAPLIEYNKENLSFNLK